MSFTSPYQLVCAIAPHLTGFLPEKGDGEHTALLIADPGSSPEVLRIRAPRRGRIDVGGVFPRLARYPPGKFRITVSVEKAAHPERIAREIERRLLPGYRRALQEAVAARNAELSEHERRVAALTRLVDEWVLTSTSITDRYRGYFLNGRMELHSEGLASLEIGFAPQGLVEEVLRRFVELQRGS